MWTLAIIAAAATAAAVLPDEAIIHLDSQAYLPSQEAADAFATNHKQPALFKLAQQAIEINNCLASCLPNQCKPECKTYNSNNKQQLNICIPQKCHSYITQITPYANNAGAPVIAEAGIALRWENKKIKPCNECLVAHWASSQIIADLASACEQIKTYANATTLFYAIGYGEPGVYSTLDEKMPRKLKILLARHPRAQNILAAARTIKSHDFCNLFATARVPI